jgi:phage gp29-like protein
MKLDLKQLATTIKGLFNTPIADPSTDYNFFSRLYALPNPDPILREMGNAESVYRGILTDPHVAGEVRSIRGNFREHRRRIVVGEEGNARAEAARELCEQWMQSCPPNDICDWEEVLWQMTCAIFTGYAVHEIVWDKVGNNILPTQVIDRPSRRFRFDHYGAPLLVSIGQPLGVPVEPYQFVISRHSASAQNPYGMALLSSCFWAWTFKTGGWRYFVKYCERHGIPMPLAKYPQGTQDKEIEELSAALEAMLENAYAVIPDGNSVELIEAKASGTSLPQEALINLANREMSKALVGQSSVGENTTGVGSRASNETAFKRQEAINAADRDIANAGINQIFHWITLFNFGEDVPPPTMEFFKVSEAGKDRAETYEIAQRLGAKPSKAALLEELNIPAAKDADDELQTPADAKLGETPTLAAAPPATFAAAALPTTLPTTLPRPAGLRFAQGLGLDDAAVAALAAQAANQIIDDTVFQSALAMLAQYEADGKTLADFQNDLGKLVGTDDGEALRTMTETAIKLSYLQGMAVALTTSVEKAA